MDRTISRQGVPRTLWLAGLVLLVWVCIYLPELGTSEVQGNEARRMLPARTMLDTGNWIVPELAGRPYFKKPPLINWMIAAAIALTGQDNEWAGRLPTVLCVLAFALALVAVPCPWMDSYSRTLAALVFLTSYAMMLEGRYAEIDPILACLTGLAVWWWVSQYPDPKRPFRLWLPCGVLLGLGLLLKGPLILLFFYAVVVAVLVANRDLKMLLKPAHFLSLAIMVTIFAIWAVPALSAARSGAAEATWSSELTGKMRREWDPLKWGRRVLGAALNFTPWLLLVPSAWRLQKQDSERARIFKGLWIGAAVCFVALCLMPGTRTRYTIPLVAVTCIPLGHYLGRRGLEWGYEPKGFLDRSPLFLAVAFVVGWVAQLGIALWTQYKDMDVSTTPHLATAVLALAMILAIVLGRRRKVVISQTRWGHPLWAAVLLACASLLANTFVTPALSLDNYKRPVGRTLAEHLDLSETLYLCLGKRDQYEPFLYYLPYDLSYVWPDRELDPQMRYLFAIEDLYAETQQRLAPSGRQLHTLCQLTYKHDDYFLGEILPAAEP